VKSLVDLWEHLARDCARRTAVTTVSRDCKTARSRVENEGESFLTISLPAFCKDFEKSLDLGKLAPGAFAGWKPTAAGYPRFLEGFLCKVFDSEGFLLNDASMDAIRSIRQLCLFAKKLLRPCSDERVTMASKAFIDCDDSLVPSDGQTYRYFKQLAAILCEELCLRGEEFTAHLKPRHGPGATREHISGNQKWNFVRWHTRLDDVGFTYFKYGRGTSSPITLSDLVRADYLNASPPVPVLPGDEEPVRVVFVPKTLKTPRVIAVEPVLMQYAQQALSSYLQKHLETCFYSAGHVNFTDQTINQVLALEGSRSGRLATLDMSEASDRVSLTQVEDMFESVPLFRDWVLACRSTRAELPTGDIITLKKFASMGSALCFPVESMVFYLTIIASRMSRAGVFPTKSSLYSFSRDVYVYGDDLIVPADEAAAISDDLESVGFKVNRHKSFWTGKFRESCGADCYDNELVTPVYLRRDLPADRADVSSILSTLETSKQLLVAGYEETAAALRNAVEDVMGKLPQVPGDSAAIGWSSYSEEFPAHRWNKRYQRREYLCWTAQTIRDPDPLDGDRALAKCLRMIRGGANSLVQFLLLTEPDLEHLDTSARPYGLSLKRRWVPL